MEVEIVNLKHHITVDAFAFQKFQYIMQTKYDKEFTAFFHAEKRENGEYHLYDIFFPRQDNAATTTECDSEDLIDLMMKEGMDISKASGHAHSHVNMSVFASRTDKKDILERARESGWNAAIIVNKKGEIFGHIADLETGIYVTKVPVYIEYPFTTDEYESTLYDLVQNSKNLEDVKTILRITDADYFDMNYPMTPELIEELENVIKDKFKSKYQHTSYNGNKYGHNSNQYKDPYNKNGNLKPTVFLDNKNVTNKNIFEDSDLEEDVPENQYADWFTDDEMDIIYNAMEKSIGSLTDKEYKLLTEYDAFFHGGHLDY